MRLFFGNTQQRVDGASSINASVNSLTFDSTGSPIQYFDIITTTYGWSFASAPSWVNGGPTTGAVGTTEVNVSCDSNPGAERSGELRINLNVSGKVLIIPITQTGI